MLDRLETWEFRLMGLIESMTTSQLSGPNILTSLKPNSKTQINSNEKELPLKTVACSGLTSQNTLLTLKNMPDKPDTPKETLKPLTSSSKDSQPESLQMFSNHPMQLGIMQPNRKPLRLPKPSYSLMQLSQLKEPKLLQAAIETEEQHLRLYHYLLKEMHHITLSSTRTMEEEAEATIEETTGTIISNKEDSSNNNDSTPPMPHNG